MMVLYLQITLRAAWCDSLKDKRAEVKKLIARLRNTFNASVCEVASQDAHHTITLGVAAIAFDGAQADSIAASVVSFVESNTEAELLSVDRSLL